MPLDLHLGILGRCIKTSARRTYVSLSLWGSGFGRDGRHFLTARDILCRAYSRGHDERGFIIAVRASHLTEKPSDLVSY